MTTPFLLYQCINESMRRIGMDWLDVMAWLGVFIVVLGAVAHFISSVIDSYFEHKIRLVEIILREMKEKGDDEDGGHQG